MFHSKIDVAMTETVSALMYLHMLRCGPPYVRPGFKEPGLEGREEVQDKLDKAIAQFPFIDSPLELARIFAEVVDEKWVAAHALVTLESALTALREHLGE